MPIADSSAVSGIKTGTNNKGDHKYVASVLGSKPTQHTRLKRTIVIYRNSYPTTSWFGFANLRPD